MLAMEDQRVISELNVVARKTLCDAVRQHLMQTCGLSRNGYPFLSHDLHFGAICDKLRPLLHTSWLPTIKPCQTSFTCIVYDRFNRQKVSDVNGGYSEIVETLPVFSAAPASEALTIVLTLYCNTNEYGDGIHYEWIRAIEKDSNCYVHNSSVSHDESSSSSTENSSSSFETQNSCTYSSDSSTNDTGSSDDSTDSSDTDTSSAVTSAEPSVPSQSPTESQTNYRSFLILKRHEG